MNSPRVPATEPLAIIPARAGSKRIPRKNLCMIAGKPLIEWTIQTALAAETKLRVVVSTDDQEIAEISRAAGAEVPFIRPAEFAGDQATSEDTVLHALDWLYRHEQYSPDLLLLLQPTSPLRSSGDIDNAFALQAKAGADAVVSVTENCLPLQWLREIDGNGRLKNTAIAGVPQTNQDPPQLYLFNGAVYLIKNTVLRELHTFYPPGSCPLIMPQERSIDIDSIYDLHLAELLLQDRQRQQFRTKD